MGSATAPDGSTLHADGRSLLLNDRPWLPVMGEFHFSRYPEEEWESELWKMKAGGIDIVSTYVFWIHHEECEGVWDWTGRRNLRRFINTCAAVGLLALVRCGPWCHGEVRNGGFPDWLLHKGYKLRTNDPRYLDEVRRLFGQIGEQIHGMFWTNGAPIIGIQFENEYQGPAEHMLELKSIAIDAGLDAPLYTRTGWTEFSTPMPYGEMIPLLGSYVEGFWDRQLTPMPNGYGNAFLFLLAKSATSGPIGTDQFGVNRNVGAAVDTYPYLCCEIGGGMETSYHRRIQIEPKDIESATLVKMGSGNNMPGYYMYHGGVNPIGKFSTLQESQATGYWNDVPVKSYDFHAPLGEYGQINAHYHLLRRIHLFLRDWGSEVAAMTAYLPAITPSGFTDTKTLRWAVRTDGKQGLLFINNYQRLQFMPAKSGVMFELNLPNSPLTLPDEPFTVPENSLFFWPINMDLGAVTLRYATAQPVCRITEKSNTYVVFAQIAGVASDFVFDGTGITVESRHGIVLSDGNVIQVRDVQPGMGAAISLNTPDGPIQIILLTEKNSLGCWKARFAGADRIFLTESALCIENAILALTAENAFEFNVSILPAPVSLFADGREIKARTDGLFHRYSTRPHDSGTVNVEMEVVQGAGPARTVQIGSQGVAEEPSDADFESAAVWRITLPANTDSDRDLMLRIRYAGDVARIYLDGSLIDDNFYNGDPFDLGLKRFGRRIFLGELLLKILPLRKDAPIYIERNAMPGFNLAESVVSLTSVDVVEMRQVRFAADGHMG